MGHNLTDRGFGDKADMRRHPLFPAHCHRTVGRIQMDFLLTEMKRCTAFADARGLHAENTLVEFQAAVDIGDCQVQMVYTLDLHGWPRCLEDPQLVTICSLAPAKPPQGDRIRELPR